MHFRDARGRWADIDTTLELKGPGRFRPKGSGLDVDVAANHQDRSLARLSLDKDHAIEFSLTDARSGTAQADKATMAYRDGELARAEPKGLRYRLLHTAARIVRRARGSPFAYPSTGPGPPRWPAPTGVWLLSAPDSHRPSQTSTAPPPSTNAPRRRPEALSDLPPAAPHRSMLLGFQLKGPMALRRRPETLERT